MLLSATVTVPSTAAVTATITVTVTFIVIVTYTVTVAIGDIYGPSQAYVDTHLSFVQRYRSPIWHFAVAVPETVFCSITPSHSSAETLNLIAVG
jgi:hypothetical protein